MKDTPKKRVQNHHFVLPLFREKLFSLFLSTVIFLNIFSPAYAVSTTKSIEAEYEKFQSAFEAGDHDEAFKYAQTLYEPILAFAEKTKPSEGLTVKLHQLSTIFSKYYDYKRAVLLATLALHHTKHLLGPDHPDTATSLADLGLLYRNQGNYNKAERLYKKALEIRKKTVGPNHPATATSLKNLALLYYYQSNYTEADPLFARALKIREETLGPDHPDTANSLNDIAMVYLYQGNYADAEPLLERALYIYEKTLGPSHPDTATSLNSLALLYYYQSNYTEAEPLFARALKIREETLGPDHPDTANSLNDIAMVYLYQGNYADAEPLLERALYIHEKTLGSDHLCTAASLNNLAQLHLYQGNYNKAEPLYKRALIITENALGPNNPDTATSLNNLALLYHYQGNFIDAESLYKSALRIHEKALGPNHLSTATYLNNLALIYRDQGNFNDAVTLLKRALVITEETLGSDNSETAASLNNLAQLYHDQGNFSDAEKLFERALRISEQALGPNHPTTATLASNLALLYYYKRNFTEAESLFERTLIIREKTLGAGHPETAISLNNLALLYRDQGILSDAEKLFKRALEIRENTLGADHPYYARSLENLGFVYTLTHRYADALSFFQKAYRIRRKLTEQIFSYTTERERMAFSETLNPYGSFALLNSSSDLALALLQFKGSVLDSVIEDRDRIAASSDERVRELYERGLGLRASYGQLEGIGPGVETRRLELQSQIDAVERELARYASRLGYARRSFEVTPEMVASVLPVDTVLIEYICYSRPNLDNLSQTTDHYGAVVYPSAKTGMAPVWIPLGEAEVIDNSVRLYKHFVRGVGRESDIQKLYQLVMKPLLRELPSGTGTLVLSPDGELNFVSFATLLDLDSKFLSEHYDLRYVSSGRDLVLERDRSGSVSGKLVAVGNPTFDTSKTSTEMPNLPANTSASPRIRSLDLRDLRNLNLHPLPGAEAEVLFLEAQADRWGLSALTFINEAATEEGVRSLSSPQILHLATHGFFLPEPERPHHGHSLGQSQLSEAATGFGGPRRFAVGPLSNPMHRSGLAFAGAQSTLDAWGAGTFPPSDTDGILTADEVGLLNLDGTWLVVLSACDTGTGEARAGQGVLGLRRGFMYSGAKNLMLTLWPVEDAYTQNFMEQFYTQALEDGDVARTLFELQRSEMIRIRKERGLAAAVRLAGPFVLNNNETIAKIP